MTPFRRHVEKWKDCRKCSLCEGRQRVVLSSGRVPCDILLVGEAPGESEDTVGRPFCGPSGQLLRQLVERAMPAGSDGEPPLDVAFTNLVCCIPKGEDGGKLSQPEPQEIKHCSERLQEFARIADGCPLGEVREPFVGRLKLVVCVGSLAKHWLMEDRRGRIKLHRGVKMVHVEHPAAIVRMPDAHKNLAAQRVVVVLRAAFEEALP